MLRIIKKEISLRASRPFNRCTKELKKPQAGVLVFVGEFKKEGVRGLGAYTWSCQ